MPNRTDWRLRAASVDQAIEIEKIAGVLETLEALFEPLVRSIPPWADAWTGPEDLA
ncbi:MAG TPA: hypothetical protein VKX39_18630 [Bryobacteraceae bacterium]|jgi:hypothetical protein|nr:hypothetical protein [Bryobacteraceae bacterium]